MAERSITLTAHVAWWWKWYAAGVYMMALLTGLEPNPEKVVAKAQRAVTWRAR